MAIEFQSRLPQKVPAAANVYALSPPRVSTARLVSTAKALGLGGDGKDFITAADRFAYQEGRHYLEMHVASGAIAFRHLDRYGRQAAETFNLSDQRAQAIAQRFLSRAKLFPMDSAKLRKVTHLRSADADVSSRKATETVVDAGIVYGRLVDGFPVDGPGGIAMVYINAEGQVVGLRSIWRGLGKRVGRVKIKSPDEALEAFQKTASRLHGDITVTKVGLGYFEHGAQDRQTVIEPAYSFIYVLRSKDIAQKSAYVVHAGEKNFGYLIGRNRFAQKPQGTRRE